MTCPFLRESQVKFCRTASVRKLIPLTLAGKADTIGKYEIYFGNFRKLFSLAGELNRVSAADVRRVARTYLAAANRTVAVMVPGRPGDQAQESSE